MARKFVTIEEAAESLGVSVDEINEMRERGEIHAYRDGGSWKFREDEVERVQAGCAGVDDTHGFVLLLHHLLDQQLGVVEPAHRHHQLGLGGLGLEEKGEPLP